MALEHFDTSRFGAFTLFHRLRNPLHEGTTADITDIKSGRLKGTLNEMSPLPRQILLLTVLEGFTIEAAADIVGIAHSVAKQALSESRKELQRVVSARILVIEDEAVIALDIADIARNAGHEVVGIAATEKAAIELAAKHTPNLILADIQLRGADSGITAVERIVETMQVPIIFVTNYPERLLTKMQFERAFVVSKPFDADLLRAAIAQALDTVSI